VYSASGDGKIPYVDLCDVAAVALVTLTQLGHLGKTYVVTGSEALSYREAAEIISAEIGKPLCFIDGTQDEARGYLRLSERRREDSDDHDHCRRPHWPGAPRTFAEFAHENAAVFRG